MIYFKCLDCAQSANFTTKEDLEAHIAHKHLNFLPYECQLCKFAMFPTRYFMISHYKEVHAMKAFKLFYCYTRENDAKQLQLEAKLAKCLTVKDGVPLPAIIVAPQGTDTPDPTNNCPEVTRVSKIEQSTEKIVKCIHAVIAQMTVPSQESPQKPSYTKVARRGNVVRHQDNQGTIPRHNYMVPVTISTIPKDQPSSSNSEATLSYWKRKGKSACTICHVEVVNDRLTQISHANATHGNFATFECGYCHNTLKTYRVSGIQRHITAFHQNVNGNVDQSNFIDYRKVLKNELYTLRKMCFPNSC